MAFLFSINKKGNVLLNPDAVKLCPILDKLTEDELMAIILAYDYGSPLKQLSEQERMRRSKVQVFKDKKNNFWDSSRIKEAVDMYVSLQYDERREQLKTYQIKIGIINDEIRRSDSPITIANLIKTNTELRKAINQIDEELMLDEERESIIVQGKGKLSLLEKMLRNKEKYAEVIKKRESEGE